MGYQMPGFKNLGCCKSSEFQCISQAEYVFGMPVGCEIRRTLLRLQYDVSRNPPVTVTEYLKGLDQMKKDSSMKDSETGEITYLNNIGLIMKYYIISDPAIFISAALCSRRDRREFPKR